MRSELKLSLQLRLPCEHADLAPHCRTDPLALQRLLQARFAPTSPWLGCDADDDALTHERLGASRAWGMAAARDSSGSAGPRASSARCLALVRGAEALGFNCSSTWRAVYRRQLQLGPSSLASFLRVNNFQDAPAQQRVSIYTARTLNATGQYRVTLSLR